MHPIIRTMRHAPIGQVGRARTGPSVFAPASFRKHAGPPVHANRFPVHRHALPGRGPYGCRHYSQVRNINGNAGPQTLPTRQEIIDSIAHQRTPSPYAPLPVDHRNVAQSYPEATQVRIKALDSLISKIAQAANKRPAWAEHAGSLLTAFDALAAAEKVFVCAGANTGDGRAETDEPVAATTAGTARPAQSGDPFQHGTGKDAPCDASMAGITQLHQGVHSIRLAWPREVEEARLYGRTATLPPVTVITRVDFNERKPIGVKHGKARGEPATVPHAAAGLRKAGGDDASQVS